MKVRANCNFLYGSTSDLCARVLKLRGSSNLKFEVVSRVVVEQCIERRLSEEVARFQLKSARRRRVVVRRTRFTMRGNDFERRVATRKSKRKANRARGEMWIEGGSQPEQRQPGPGTSRYRGSLPRPQAKNKDSRPPVPFNCSLIALIRRLTAVAQVACKFIQGISSNPQFIFDFKE